MALKKIIQITVCLGILSVVGLYHEAHAYETPKMRPVLKRPMAQAKRHWLVAPREFAAMAATRELKLDLKVARGSLGIYPASIKQLAQFSQLIHEEKDRCGGMLAFETFQAAEQSLLSFNGDRPKATNPLKPNYKIDQVKTVEQSFTRIQESMLVEMITQLSRQFKNRFAMSEEGIKASHWLKDYWQKLTAHRTDVKVELFEHKLFPQPSVVMTIQGESSEVVMVTAHLDSIGEDSMVDPENDLAPGADDNASGIAVITEAARVLMLSNYRPAKTLMFVAFAAEEVGLMGSQEMVADFKRKQLPILGAVNFDMTNFNGSNADIVLMKDGTDSKQNAFLAQLIQQYQPLMSVGYDKCGYGCSDHFNLHVQGVPVSMPSEARMDETNPKIHTAKDTFSGDVTHAMKFARLALSYLLEMDR